MAENFRPANGWGPSGKRAALSITFDNFGEAAELGRGQWHGEVGAHFTARFLPRLIEVLGDIKATYFMEGSNAPIYPDAIKAWRAAGHEVALHGWQHEFWLQTPPESRIKLLADSAEAMRHIGIDLVGFRPPGGGMPPEAWQELADAGFLYCSAAGPQGVGRIGQLVSLPFEWRAVDAFMIEPILGFLRVHLGDREEAYSLSEWHANLDQMLQQLVETGGHRTVIFHPEFLGVSDDKLQVLQDFIAAASSKELWIAPGREVAGFIAQQIDLPVLEAA